MKSLLATLLLGVGLLTPPPPVWEWPIDGEQLVVRDFNAPSSPWGPGHRGLDLRGRAGATVYAPVSGTIHYSGHVVDRGVVTIRTSQGWLVSLEPVEAEHEGRRVSAGEPIGTLQRGHCPGGCLHVGLRINGEYRSPALELGILRRAVLKPVS